MFYYEKRSLKKNKTIYIGVYMKAVILKPASAKSILVYSGIFWYVTGILGLKPREYCFDDMYRWGIIVAFQRTRNFEKRLRIHCARNILVECMRKKNY